MKFLKIISVGFINYARLQVSRFLVILDFKLQTEKIYLKKEANFFQFQHIHSIILVVVISHSCSTLLKMPRNKQYTPILWFSTLFLQMQRYKECPSHEQLQIISSNAFLRQNKDIHFLFCSFYVVATDL